MRSITLSAFLAATIRPFRLTPRWQRRWRPAGWPAWWR
jgi:hypothetical protein